MPRYIAFLRAINVGGRTVKMERLRSVFEELALKDVETFIASGNVIFSTRVASPGKLEQRITTHLRKVLGYEVATFLRTPEQLAEVAHREAFGDASSIKKPAARMVAFLHSAPTSEARAKLMALKSSQDDFAVVGHEVHWECRTKISESKFSGSALEKALGRPATMRSITTIQKLSSKYPPL